MLFTIDKNKSLSILQVVMALFIIVAPSILGFVDYSACAYALLVVAGLLFVLRTVGKGQVSISLQPLILLILIVFSLISLMWVNNRGIQLVYLTVLVAVTGMFCLMLDYFSENTDEKIKRRMMYMVSMSGILCAVFNFFHWVTKLVPYGKRESFMQGIGSNHFLAVFMLVTMVVTMSLVRKNSSFRKCVFSLSVIMMLFVFVMCKSFYGWMFAIAVGIIFFTEQKSKKLFFSVSSVIIAVFGIVTLTVFFASKDAVVFKEVFSYGNLIGRGGGYFSEGKLFLSSDNAVFSYPGLLSSVYAASGLIGISCLIILAARIVMHFIKLRTWESVVNVLITVMMLFLPLATSLGTLLLWIGLTAYNENAAGGTVNRTFRPDVIKKITCVTAGVCVVAVYLLCQRYMTISAGKKYDRGKYMEAYSLYKAASSVNPFDSESCIGTAQSLYKSGNIRDNYTEAVEFVEKAQKRDEKNISYNSVKAQLHTAYGRHDLAVQEYTYISSVAKVNSKYNLLLVESIYKIAEGYPEGSPEAMDYYEEIVKIANKTKDLDYREKINNIADKALIYARRRTEE